MEVSIDCETANEVITLVNSASTEDKKFRIDMYNRFADKHYLANWVNNQEVKLLILDGSYGGRNGMDFYYLSTDLKAQDDWHIGKKYDMQGWFRYPVVVYKDNLNIVGVRNVGDNEVHNAYLVVSKKEIRCKSKNLKRAKTEELETISNKMVEKFMSSFNSIGRGEVFYFEFSRPLETYTVADIYGNLIEQGYNQYIVEEVMCNIPFNDEEFDTLFEKVLTFQE